MNKRPHEMYLAYIAQTLLGANVIIAAELRDFPAVMLGGLMFLVGLIPYLITWKMKIVFPWFVYLLVSLALLIHASGYIQERYIMHAHWDKFAHLVSGSAVALIGFLFVMFLDYIRQYNLDHSFIALFTVLFTLACEYCWEVAEFLVDTFFGGSFAGPMQLSNTDTMMDMIFVFMPGVFFALLCYN
ncbi:MAG: hypothetical protein KO206_01230 [Methanomicrobiaceae archaeon]|uniref:Membrane protein n=1 Tax=hydrocarbon metagenome TaxID=938273 RepID=A0A0W8FHE3_9ZZZZ|nr:hypothetical protein [Methanomicrobiaceae archaeon]MDD5420369.1 hypothetical protein [Methanomicrobiaceae archaeon]